MECQDGDEEEGFVAGLLRSVEERITKGTASKVVTEKWGEVIPEQWIGVREFPKVLHSSVEPEFRLEINTIVRLGCHFHLHRKKKVCFNCWLPKYVTPTPLPVSLQAHSPSLSCTGLIPSTICVRVCPVGDACVIYSRGLDQHYVILICTCI
jgi:hypothetical protein